MDAISQVMASVMKVEVDYGVIPGTKKPTLFQPGSEILFRLFNYSFEVEVVDKVEDWQNAFFRYQVKGIARDESGRIIAEGLGEANSKESRYQHRFCPKCESGVWDNRNDSRGGAAFVCKAKCGFTADLPSEVPTKFDFELVNTILKMAVKRAKIAAALTGTAASHFFTQDTEDLSPDFVEGNRPSPAVPTSADEPHCPACLAVNGELVAVEHQSKKPYWRCSRRGDACGGPREYNGKTYSWAGWHESWENSATEWLNENGYQDGLRSVEVGGRGNYWAWVLDEISKTCNVSPEVAKTLGKPGLVAALTQGLFDPAEALGITDEVEGVPQEVVVDQLTDDDLRAIAQNMTAGEAQIVVGAAVSEYEKTQEAPF
jgi:hypothetical protein